MLFQSIIFILKNFFYLNEIIFIEQNFYLEESL